MSDSKEWFQNHRQATRGTLKLHEMILSKNFQRYDKLCISEMLNEEN